MWEALSTLFLDTDVSLLRESRARSLARSPYSVHELEAILRDEVFPVCKWNLASIAGEWAQFDPEWLEERILARLRRGRRWSFGLGQLLVTRSREWRSTRRAVEALRRGGAA